MTKNILISGGSGLVGRAVTKLLLAQGYAVGWLTRTQRSANGVKIFLWDVDAGIMDEEAIRWAHCIVHLAGEGIAEKRWTAKRKALIISSRKESAELILNKLRLVPNSVTSVICASAIGWYGNNRERRLQEDIGAGNGFLGDSVKEWEAATSAFRTLPIRVVQLRIGIVLAKNGGALPELMMTSRLRVLPVMGTGNQTYSWIHIDDVAGIIQFAIENNFDGAYNTVAPNPVSQKQIMHAIRKVKNKFYFIVPVPAFFLRIILGEMADAVLIDQDVSADKIVMAGYQFRFSVLQDCLSEIFEQ